MPGPARLVGALRRADDRSTCRVIVAVVGLVLTVPFVVMAVVQRAPRWFPTLDQAMIELLVRDVGGADSPTTGLVGRFPVEGQQADHPGPLSWYVLWPLYRLFGSTSAALTVANVVCGLLAVVVLLWLLSRRGRPGLVLLVAVFATLLGRAYGTIILGEVWNPHLPVLWWLVTVFAVWSVLVGDRPSVVVAVIAGSLCAQTHISYCLPVAVLFAAAATALVVAAVRDPSARRSSLSWLGVGFVTLAVLWAPVVYDQLAHDPGNLWLLWRYFTASAQAPVGWVEGIDVVLVHLDPSRLVSGELWGDRQSDLTGFPSGSAWPGAVTLVLWGIAAVASWRLGDWLLVKFHLVVAITLAAAAIAVSRVLPPVWYWVVLFLWGVQVIVGVAIAWTAWLVVQRRLDRHRQLTARRVVRAGALAAIAVIAAVWVGETIVGPRLADNPQSRLLDDLVPPTVAALRSGTLPGGGIEGTYRITWAEPIAFGSAGYGLLNELERAGFDVGADEQFSPQVRPHRVADTSTATALVEIAGGAYIDEARARPGAVVVAYTDPRTDEQRRRSDQLRTDLIDLLAGDPELRRNIDEDPVGLLFSPDLDPAAVPLLEELVTLGAPLAVVVSPLP